jgi:hypothetical protein
MHIPKTENSKNLTTNPPELGDSRALEPVQRGHGGWLLVAAAARGGHAAILVNRAPRCG